MASRGAPEVSQGRPGTKRVEHGLRDPLPRDPVGRPNSDFLSILWAFFRIVFVECRLRKPPGPILGGFGEVFIEIFEHLLIHFSCEAKAVKSNFVLLFTAV